MAISKREVVRQVFAGEKPAYVPWHYQFTHEAWDKLVAHFGGEDAAETAIDNHILELGAVVGFFEPIGNERYRDVFGVVWNRTVDKDIGIVEGLVLPEPTMKDLRLPDPHDERFFCEIPGKIARWPDRFRIFYIGFSLFERAWTLRGMENLMMDFFDHPEFVDQLLGTIADYNIAQVHTAAQFDIDGVYFGDDWGQQQGMIMGKPHWERFILPHLRRMYGAVRGADKFQMIHSCGDVDELFDDLVAAGVNCFNPFQPEIMDTAALVRQYRGRLAFHGGLSTQRLLPFGTAEQVKAQSRRLIELGRDGGYIFAPGHAVEGDVPLENMIAFIEAAKRQRDYC